MRIAPEALNRSGHLLVDHRVMGDGMFEFAALGVVRQFAVIEQIAGFDEVAMLGQLVDGIAAIEQNAFIAVDVGDLGFACCRRGEAGIDR